MFFTYVLYSKTYDRIYIGQTGNLTKRLDTLNSAKEKSTKHWVPWELVHVGSFATRSEAMRREKELKSHSGRDYIREKLILYARRKSQCI